MDAVFERILEKVVNLGGVKTCERNVEVGALEVRYDERQLIFVPFAGNLIESYV